MAQRELSRRDNFSVKVNAVVYFRVVHPNRAIVEVENNHNATAQLARTTLRSVRGRGGRDAARGGRVGGSGVRWRAGSRSAGRAAAPGQWHRDGCRSACRGAAGGAHVRGVPGRVARFRDASLSHGFNICLIRQKDWRKILFWRQSTEIKVQLLGRIALFGLKALMTASLVSTYGPPIRSMQ